MHHTCSPLSLHSTTIFLPQVHTFQQVLPPCPKLDSVSCYKQSPTNITLEKEQPNNHSLISLLGKSLVHEVPQSLNLSHKSFFGKKTNQIIFIPFLISNKCIYLQLWIGDTTFYQKTITLIIYKVQTTYQLFKKVQLVYLKQMNLCSRVVLFKVLDLIEDQIPRFNFLCIFHQEGVSLSSGDANLNICLEKHSQMLIHSDPKFAFQTIIFHKNGLLQTLLEFKVLVPLFSKENDSHLNTPEI